MQRSPVEPSTLVKDIVYGVFQSSTLLPAPFTFSDMVTLHDIENRIPSLLRDGYGLLMPLMVPEEKRFQVVYQRAEEMNYRLYTFDDREQNLEDRHDYKRTSVLPASWQRHLDVYILPWEVVQHMDAYASLITAQKLDTLFAPKIFVVSR